MESGDRKPESGDSNWKAGFYFQGSGLLRLKKYFSAFKNN
jgi:hypothetical protein